MGNEKTQTIEELRQELLFFEVIQKAAQEDRWSIYTPEDIKSNIEDLTYRIQIMML